MIECEKCEYFNTCLQNERITNVETIYKTYYMPIRCVPCIKDLVERYEIIKPGE